MLNKILISFFLFYSTAFASEVCSDGEIKYIQKKKTIIKKAKFCKNEDKVQASIYSINCSNRKCKFLKEPFKRPVDLRKYASTVGSPGFKLCRELKGSPQIIQYKFSTDKVWSDDSRCIINRDTFISNSILLEVWKDIILTN